MSFQRKNFKKKPLNFKLPKGSGGNRKKPEYEGLSAKEVQKLRDKKLQEIRKQNPY